MKERIELLCKMLSVELEEEFMLEGYGDNKFYFGGDGLYGKTEKRHSIQTEKVRYTVDWLLEAKVIKLPWKPKVGEKYYYINEFVERGYDFAILIDKTKRIINRVQVYRTEEEAIAAVKEKGWVVE